MSHELPAPQPLTPDELTERLKHGPLLSYSDVPPDIDLADKLKPEDQAAIPPGCRIVSVREITIEPATLSSLQALYDLTEQHSAAGINAAHAPIAAGGNKEEDAALRRFEAVHGRDALEIALRLSEYYPGLLKNTILDLAASQGTTYEQFDPYKPFRQEEPGKIILVDRDKSDPVAAQFSKEMGWGFPFYGSVDATITYILAIDHYAKSHPDIWDARYQGRSGESTIRQSFDLASEWVLTQLNQSPSGFVEFKNKDPRPGHGIDCQSWRDSSYAYVHADGSRANIRDGIASFDIQVMSYQALNAISDRFKITDPQKSKLIAEEAESFRQKAIDAFWVDTPSESFFALGIDHDPATMRNRQIAVKASSMSHALTSNFLRETDPDDLAKIKQTVAHLVSPELLAYAGVRTVANDEVCYGPNTYHTGSVWPWDSECVARCLEEKEYHHLAWEIRSRLLRITNESHMLPEFVGGYQDSLVIPTTEAYACNDTLGIVFLFGQAPQPRQGWTISALLDIKKKAPAFFMNKPPMSRHEHSLYEHIPNKAVEHLRQVGARATDK